MTDRRDYLLLMLLSTLRQEMWFTKTSGSLRSCPETDWTFQLEGCCHGSRTSHMKRVIIRARGSKRLRATRPFKPEIIRQYSRWRGRDRRGGKLPNMSAIDQGHHELHQGGGYHVRRTIDKKWVGFSDSVHFFPRDRFCPCCQKNAKKNRERSRFQPIRICCSGSSAFFYARLGHD